MGNVTNTTLAIVTILLIIGLIIYIFEPFLLYRIILNLTYFIITKIDKVIINKIIVPNTRDIHNYHYLLYLKIYSKIDLYNYILIDMLHKLFLFLYIRYEDIVGKENIPRELEERRQMAIKAISAGRIYYYVCKSERTFKDSATGEQKVMPLDEAIAVAADKNFTVFHMTSRSARRAAEERDRMTEISTRNKKMVYELRTGTTDFHLLISSISGWDRLTAPDGVCDRCGITHTSEFIDFEELINSKANQDKIKAGAFKNEIAIDHIPDYARQELVTFVRNIDNGGTDLGEESSQSIDG